LQQKKKLNIVTFLFIPTSSEQIGSLRTWWAYEGRHRQLNNQLALSYRRKEKEGRKKERQEGRKAGRKKKK